MAHPILHAHDTPRLGADPDAPLAALSATGAPLRRALARIAGRLVSARAWDALGYVRAADYARERAGISGRELLDLAAVDTRLAELPRCEAAFVAGELSWTKLRLLCRAATAEDEAHWLAAAVGMSAARLSREVRAVDRGSLDCLEAGPAPAEDEEPGEVLRIRCSRRTLGMWGNARRLARRMHGTHVPAAEVAEAVAAEVVSALPLEVDPEALPVAAEVRRAQRAAADAPVLPPPGPAPTPAPFLDALVDGLAEAGPRELDARLRRAAALDRGLLARLGPLLLELASTRAYRDVGCRRFDEYARERLGMSPRKARTLLRVERACTGSPALREAWRTGALSLTQAHTLVALFALDESRPWHRAWIARAAQVTLRRLEDDVDAAIAVGGDLDPAELPAVVPEGPHPAGLQIGARPTATEERDQLRVWAPVDVARLFRATLATVQRRIERTAGRPSTPGEALEAMLRHVVEAWKLQRLQGGPLPREHRVMERDGWRCTVPGCTSYANLHAHHIVFRSAGGSDSPHNLTTLCAAHHQRGVHGGGPLRITGRAPATLRFDLPLESYAAGDLRIGLYTLGQVS